MNAGPACPIRFTPLALSSSLTDDVLTAAEIEWRCWSGRQLERRATRGLRRKWIGYHCYLASD